MAKKVNPNPFASMSANRKEAQNKIIENAIVPQETTEQPKTEVKQPSKPKETSLKATESKKTNAKSSEKEELKQVSLRVPFSVYEPLRQIAAMDTNIKSMSKYINILLEKELNRCKKDTKHNYIFENLKMK